VELRGACVVRVARIRPPPALQPGDVLGSGTCGFGCLLELWGRYGRDSHPPLQPGDEVELAVEHLGTLTNRVVAGSLRTPFLPPAEARAAPGAYRETVRNDAKTPGTGG
jgi:hypothetical protein